MLALALFSTASFANNNLSGLKILSLEQLSQTTIALTSKKEKNIEEVASAAYVISQEDIRRSGATSLPELFRGVPGLNVYQVDANKWAVSARGFAGLFSNKMLVMIDGRSVYDPLFAGVYWADHDLFLPDIKKIEIIRGPGATLWGANAVNGVINIVTKSSKETLGNIVQIGIGNYEKHILGFRHGGEISDNATYQLFAKSKKYDDFVDITSERANDEYSKQQLGFRMNLQPTIEDKIYLKGEINKQKQQARLRNTAISLIEPSFDEDDTDTAYMQVNWRHKIREEESVQLNVIYSYLNKESVFLSQKRNTFEVDLQHEKRVTPSFDFIWETVNFSV